MKRYDVIVVGAGPAGAIAGYTLGKAGMDVLLLEKTAFPRRKACGGGLTLRAYGQIPFDISAVIHSRVDWGYIAYKGRNIATIQADGPIAYLIDRASFDAFLLQKAVDQGVEVVHNQAVSDLHANNSQVQVITGESDYISRYVIGADGVHSLVRKKCGLISKRLTSISYEARLSLPAGVKDHLIDSVTFDFGTLLGGYGWIFPKRDHLNVGVYRSWPGAQVSKDHLTRYITQHPTLHTAHLLDLRAYPVPLGGSYTDLHRERIVLVGDAANLADPWLGEGLYAAITSGRIAAETIVRHLAGEISSLANYTKKVNETLTTQWVYARRFSRLVHSFPFLNVHALRASPSLQRMVIDLLRGHRSYQDICDEIKRRFPQLISQVIRNK
jgi:geranylgeranyl reductase family protein